MAAEKENVITHTYDLLKYIIPQLEKFPRSQKFVLADKIQLLLMDILGKLIEAYYGERQSPPTDYGGDYPDRRSGRRYNPRLFVMLLNSYLLFEILQK